MGAVLCAEEGVVLGLAVRGADRVGHVRGGVRSGVQGAAGGGFGGAAEVDGGVDEGAGGDGWRWWHDGSVVEDG